MEDWVCPFNGEYTADDVVITPACFGIVIGGESLDVVRCPDCGRVWMKCGDEWYEVPRNTLLAWRYEMRDAVAQLKRALVDALPSWIKRHIPTDSH